MEAPNKIYLEKSLSFPDKLHSHWYKEDVVGNGIEYIRKDSLLEWAEAMKILCEEHPACEHGNWHDGNANAYGKLIYKLNSL